MTIKPFSSNIEAHVETYGECLGECLGEYLDERSDSYPEEHPDSFETSPTERRKLYGKWMLLTTGEGLDTGYKRIKGVLKAEPADADKAADLFFAGKKITEEQEKILETGWPEIFKKVFSENFQGNFQDGNFQDPETTKKAKEFHWTQWEKAIPRDEHGKIDPRVLIEEKKAFEDYWRGLLEVMKKMYIPGKSWGIKLGEFYHKDVGWY